jgi:hypothetical protein
MRYIPGKTYHIYDVLEERTIARMHGALPFFRDSNFLSLCQDSTIMVPGISEEVR